MFPLQNAEFCGSAGICFGWSRLTFELLLKLNDPPLQLLGIILLLPLNRLFHPLQIASEIGLGTFAAGAALVSAFGRSRRIESLTLANEDLAFITQPSRRDHKSIAAWKLAELLKKFLPPTLFNVFAKPIENGFDRKRTHDAEGNHAIR